MAQIKFEDMLRPMYEARAVVAWASAALWLILLGLIFQAPRATVLACAALSVTMALIRLQNARRLLNYKVGLIGKAPTLITTSKLRGSMKNMGNNLWLGWGFEWQQIHTQRVQAIIGVGTKAEIYPPRWWLKFIKSKHDPYTAKGKSWIHGVGCARLSSKEKGEGDVMIPFEALKGHCAIIATTGAIKTRLAALIIFQLASRGDAVIVIDPKGDKDLRAICKQAAEFAGFPERFLMIHPAFASQSVRLDLMKNWDQVSQVASRVKMVLGSQDNNNFTEFCWLAVHQITSAMKYIGRRVSLYGLKTAMGSRITVERIAELALTKFFTEQAPQLLEAVQKEENAKNAKGASAKPPSRNSNEVETNSPRLSAMIKVFQKVVPETREDSAATGLPQKPDEIVGVVSILEANKEWFGKMIISITPLLTKLTTDDLRGLLSPDYDDENDLRPIMDCKRVVEGKHILYIGTDTLSDETVGMALSTMILADVSSVAAEIYNHGIESLDDGEEPRRVHVVVDEWGDAVCDPLIQQANKGRGAGFYIWALGQTFSDLVVKFGGDSGKARRFMGNMNNLIVGATNDPDTMDLITDKLGEVSVNVKSQSTGMGSKTEDVGLEFSANSSVSLQSKDVAVFRRDLLGSLPDLHYLAFVNRGELYKGRIPVLVEG